jgi:hypothetical protein
MTKDDSPADGELLGLLVLAADGYFAIGGFLRLLSSRRLSRLPSLPACERDGALIQRKLPPHQDTVRREAVHIQKSRLGLTPSQPDFGRRAMFNSYAVGTTAAFGLFGVIALGIRGFC